jgi:hypothetical protein
MTYAARALAVAVMLVGLACRGGSANGDAGSGSDAGWPSDGDAGSGSDAGWATDGEAGDGEVAAALTACPATGRPALGAACTGSFSCSFKAQCVCNVCCFESLGCSGGRVTYLGFNDACTQVNPACPDAAAEKPDADAAAGACAPGADQTCNDDPRISSLRGHCTDAGTCECHDDAAPSPTSGRCL